MARKALHPTFDFYELSQENECKQFCADYNKKYNRKHKAHYTTWESADRTEKKLICWYEY